MVREQNKKSSNDLDSPILVFFLVENLAQAWVRILIDGSSMDAVNV